jgi:hypothetical protein
MAHEDDTEMDFFRLVNKSFTPMDEIKMGIRTALELVFGEDSKLYGIGVIGGLEDEDGS